MGSIVAGFVFVVSMSVGVYLAVRLALHPLESKIMDAVNQEETQRQGNEKN